MNKRSLLFLISSFIAGFALMTVELTASRVVAPYVGSSVYTWTSVIGVILLGLSLGYYLGGFFADKYIQKNWIWISYFFSAVSVAIVPSVAPLSKFLANSNLPLPLMIPLITLLLFFLPSIFLGSISPIILKQYAVSFEKIAVSAGTLSALWSVGSIIGTFATGFLFIGYIGSAATLFSISFLLGLNGLFFCRSKFQTVLSVIIVVVSIYFLFFPLNLSRAGANTLYSKESDYYQIKVVDGSFGEVNDARILFLDFDSHSIESASKNFIGTYPDIYPIFSVFNKNPKNIFVIGGGAYSLPKYLSGYYKNSDVTVAEIDPKVKEIAEKYFNLGDYKINSKIGDGRILLRKNDSQYDLIFEDAFNSFVSLPWHLTTKEFAQEARLKLSKGGIYAVNFISSTKGEESLFFQSMLKTFREVFPNMYVFTTGGLSYYSQNVVLIGINSDEHKDVSEIKQYLASVKNGRWLASHISDGDDFTDTGGEILTDNFAPVERLMIPTMNEYYKPYSEFYYLF